MPKKIQAIAIAMFLAVCTSCSAGAPQEPNISLQRVEIDKAFPDDLEIFNRYCDDVIVGEVLSSFSYVNINTPRTLFYVRIVSVIKGKLNPGDVVSVVYAGGDMNEYLYLALHGWDHGSFSDEINLERAKTTTLRWPLGPEFNTQIGGLNMFMLGSYPDDSDFSDYYNPWASMADIGDGVYRFKDPDSEFTVTLDEMKSIVAR